MKETNKKPMSFKEFEQLYIKTLREEIGKVWAAFVSLVKEIFKSFRRKAN